MKRYSPNQGEVDSRERSTEYRAETSLSQWGDYLPAVLSLPVQQRESCECISGGRLPSRLGEQLLSNKDSLSVQGAKREHPLADAGFLHHRGNFISDLVVCLKDKFK